MTPDEIGKILSNAANRSFPVDEQDRQAAARAEVAILKGLVPVRPLAPAWVFTLLLLAFFAAAAVIAASALGMAGWRALSLPERVFIFSALLGGASFAAVACARLMRPAMGMDLGVPALITSVLLLLATFSLTLSGYGTEHLVREGIPCLKAGLCVAFPTGVAIALLLRRGVILRWSSVGIAAGALAGLAGVAMLELHCPNLKAIHVLIWHVGVVVSSGALGFFATRLVRLLARGIPT